MDQSSGIHKGEFGRNGSGSGSANLQRWGALIGGGALAVYGATRRSKSGMAMAAAGGLLAYSGSKVASGQRRFFATSSVLVTRSAEETYRFWRNFENLPRFMRHLESVSVSGDSRRSQWVAIGPGGVRLSWNAEIVSERENQSITWRSLPGSDVEVSGSVQFRPAPGNRGTMVTAHIGYLPPGGLAGHTVAKVLGKDPHFLMRQDMRRFKALLETGEIPTIEGQTHGPRSVKVALLRTADPDRPLGNISTIGDQVSTTRRAS